MNTTSKHLGRLIILATMLVLPIQASTSIPASPPTPLPWERGEERGEGEGGAWVKLEVQRLPDMNVPRSGHATYCVNGEIVVMGGHTSGFVPTPTAEYYADGKWHTMPMTYRHDQGFSLLLSSGKILIGGGHEQDLGIGQTYSVETYDPAAHRFEGFGCLDTKRCFADAVELDSGRVVITGNWYHDDDIEIFDDDTHFSHLKDVSTQRSCPRIFRTAKDDALIFSRFDNKGAYSDSIIVDCLSGGTIDVPLFREWHPNWDLPSCERSATAFIGDESQDYYAYLLPVVRSVPFASPPSSPLSSPPSREGLGVGLAIALIHGTTFSLLPTDRPVPQVTPWDSIRYVNNFIADREAGRAYLLGFGTERLYVLAVDYGQASPERPAHLTCYYTDPLESLPTRNEPALTAEGNLILAGGFVKNNFNPTASVLVLPVGQPVASARQTSSARLWYFLLAAVSAFGLYLILNYIYRRRRSQPQQSDETDEADEPQAVSSDNQELMQRIRHLMEEEQLYLNSNLKLSDIAVLLHVNRTYLSDCIKASGNGSFSQFINTYRIDYAKSLLRSNPETKISALYIKAGFANETTFFRTFKALTGMTPREYVATIDLQNHKC
ncbi:MAG: helix-turn-helix domain-containing protein [Bacteroidales bacterium]|nr:helix-turn-helix domain-containing protein [Bacteroidales bacterium]